MIAERIVVAGSLAQRPGQGGHTWVFLNYLLGLKRLGWDVLFVDRLEPEMCVDTAGRPCSLEQSWNLDYFVQVMERFGLHDDYALLYDQGRHIVGRSRAHMLEHTRQAALLLNVMGYIIDEELLACAQKRVFLDIDPGFGQMWQALGWHDLFEGHDAFVTMADIFSPGDASELMMFADSVGLGRLSMWSANRDVECGAVVDDERVSNTCSGVDQDPLEFAGIFASGKPREAGPGAEPGGGGDSIEIAVAGVSRDDPQSSPYPIWRSGKAYEQGAKVVWQGRVYEAKWWSQDDQPDAPVKEVWDTPWRYLGPVLESDAEAVRASDSLPDGEYARWTAETIYVAGDEVEHDGDIFRARWWTQAVSPEEDPDQPYDHPWEYIGPAETEDDE